MPSNLTVFNSRFSSQFAPWIYRDRMNDFVRDRTEYFRNVKTFGVVGPNGLTFTRSVKNPNSVLHRVLKAIHTYRSVNGGTDPRKIDILRAVWDFDNIVFPWGKPSARGYHATFFRIAVRAGFLRHYRDGNTVRWTFGPRATFGNGKAFYPSFLDVTPVTWNGEF